MNQQPIGNLIRQAESQVFERKRSLSLRREGLESLCGMINVEVASGTVAFGVAPDGEIVGIEPGDLDEAQRSLSQTIAGKFEPPIQPTMRVTELEGKRVLLLAAQRNRDVPYHEYNGRAFIREGTVTRQLSLSEKQSLQRRRKRDLHTGRWQCDRCGSWAGMLASVVVTEQGVRKSYACGCGGEYWPVAQQAPPARARRWCKDLQGPQVCPSHGESSKSRRPAKNAGLRYLCASCRDSSAPKERGPQNDIWLGSCSLFPIPYSLSRNP